MKVLALMAIFCLIQFLTIIYFSYTQQQVQGIFASLPAENTASTLIAEKKILAEGFSGASFSKESLRRF